MTHTFDAAPETVFADLEKRTIKGLAIPAGEVATSGGQQFRFASGSVAFGERTPLLAYHDTSRPVGRLTSHQWTDNGLEVAFQVSKTDAGDEALVLAADGVLGLSVGIDVTTAKQNGAVLDVALAAGREISLTPVPAFAGARVTAVALHANQKETVPVTDAPEVTAPVTVQLNTEGLGAEIAAAFAQIPQQQPIPVAQVREPAPYRFDGQAGAYGFVADMRESKNGDSAAAQRLQKFMDVTFAVDSTGTAALNPTTQRPDLFVSPLRYNRPLAALISTGGLDGNTPFVVPKFGTAAGLVAPHVEGTEPSLGSFTATSQTCTPGAVSGKIEITREAWENSSPQVDGLVWAEMTAAHAEALETRIAATLNALVLTSVTANGADDVLVDNLEAILIGLQFVKGGNRYTSLGMASGLYTAAVGAKDADGRKLLPIAGGTNVDGSVSPSFGQVQIGTTTGVPAWALATNSYLLVPSSVWQWASAPRRIDLDIQIKSVFVGLWGYAAEAVLRDTDVKRITHA